MRRPAPAEILRALPEPTRPLVQALLRAADERKLRAYLVGGPVRDLLLGREVRDVDLIVEARDGVAAAELAEAVPWRGARVVRHGRFGTVTLRTPQAALDLATVRSESYAHDGALPQVGPGSLEDDLLRRDFSVNALALPLSRRARSGHSGVVDFDSGLADLEARKLRVLHGRSFHDDPTRALRAARLAVRLDFDLTRGSRSALRDALRDGAFGRVSGDRLRREWVKLFDEPEAVRALRLLNDWHVLAALEPGLGLLPAARAPLRRLGRLLPAPPWGGGRWRPWVSGMALWLAPLAPGLRRRALGRFAVRGRAAESITGFSRVRDSGLRGLARARGRGAVDALLRDIDEDHLYALFASAEPTGRRRIARWMRDDRTRRPPIGGEDLVALGLSGPALGRALDRIRCAYLDGNLSTREEALALAEEVARRP